MKRARKKLKAVRNEARGTWVCFPVIGGKRTTRKLGNLNELNQQQADTRAAEIFRGLNIRVERAVPNLESVVQQYREERLSKLRYSTQKAAKSWINVHILPKWGKQAITELQPRLVELWLDSLPLAPRTRGHLRELLYRLVDFSMWAGLIPVGINPISLVTVRGSSKRKQQPRSLKVEEFHALLQHLDEPHKTMARLQVCLGLRVSELLALRWQNVDWMTAKLSVESGIVQQHVAECKTEGSRRKKYLDPELLIVLSDWRQRSEFRDPDDWLFASPVKLGKLPISYTCYKTALQSAAKAVGITGLGTHTFRHSYRSWLDAVGTTPTVQQKLMRHSDIRTTMNLYGDVITDAEQRAEAKIAGLALKSDSKLIPTFASA